MFGKLHFCHVVSFGDDSYQQFDCLISLTWWTFWRCWPPFWGYKGSSKNRENRPKNGGKLYIYPRKVTWLAGTSTMNESMYFAIEHADFPAGHVSFFRGVNFLPFAFILMDWIWGSLDWDALATSSIPAVYRGHGGRFHVARLPTTLFTMFFF